MVYGSSRAAAGRAATGSPISLKRRYRLRRQADFQSVIAGRRVFRGRAIVAMAQPRPQGETRIGVAVSRQLKGAVQRNRARRRLRAVARLRLLSADSPFLSGGIRYDVVLIARPAALELRFRDLEAEAAQLLVSLRTLTP